MGGDLRRARAAAGRWLRRWRPSDPADLERIRQLEATVTGLQASVAVLDSATAAHSQWLTDLEHGVGDVRDGHGAQLEDLAKWLGSAILTLGSLSDTPVVTSPTLQAAAPRAGRVDDLAVLRRQLLVSTVQTYLAGSPETFDTRITVVMPTRDRVGMVTDAIASVLAQRHQNFELLVIDDGSTDDTPARLAAIDDPRVRVLRTTGLGEAPARNLGLAEATGSVIAFLDDDNLMDPGWLHAVAWAFERWPDAQLLYGARVVEDAPARKSQPSGALPNFEFEAFDRRRLEQGNYIDMNAIAVRAGLEGCWFDESLRSSIDWQLVLTLSAEHPPLELPALACVYRTFAPNRVCDVPERIEHNRRVRARVHRTRPMRVLSHNAMFPLLSETYIHDEMMALVANGAEVAFNSTQVPRSPMAVDEPVGRDLLEAVRTFDPDVVFVYWATHAAGELTHLERVGRPFALRVHSFDYDPDAIKAIQAHDLCVGVWAYPHHAVALDGAHPLVPLFTAHDQLPPPAARRDLAVSVSAGLPKKSWPALFEAMDRITTLERGVVVGRSNGLEHVPDEVVERAARLADPPFVTVNATRAEVFDLLARTSVLLYTLDEGVNLGMPMSIIEAMASGACVVHPDRPELGLVAGPGFRGYRTVDDIVAHVEQISAGGPEIETERERNRTWALEQFCDPALGRRFHEELADAVERWRFDVS